jgi:hypothetical protein
MMILLEAEVVLVSSVDHLCVLGNFLSCYKLSSPIWAKLRHLAKYFATSPPAVSNSPPA